MISSERELESKILGSYCANEIAMESVGLVVRMLFHNRLLTKQFSVSGYL